MNSEVTVGDKRVKVRDVMREQLSPQLRLGEKSDAVLLRVIVSGEASGMPATYEYNLVTKKDLTVNETAMARATANTISIIAQMIGNGTITMRGVHPPEKIVPGDQYIEEMKKRGVIIQETVKTQEATV